MVGEEDKLKKAYNMLGVKAGSKAEDIHDAYQEIDKAFKEYRAKSPKNILDGAQKIGALKEAYRIVCNAENINTIAPEKVQPQKEQLQTAVRKSSSPQQQQVFAKSVVVKDTTEKAPSFDKSKDYYAMLNIDENSKEINPEVVSKKYASVVTQGKYDSKELNEAAAVLKNSQAKAAYDAARAPAQDKAVPEQEKATPTVAVNPRFPRIAAMKEGLKAMGTAMLGAKSGPPSTPSKGQNANKGPELQ